MYFFYLIEQHSKFLLRTLQVLYMCTFCDPTNLSTMIELVPNWLSAVMVSMVVLIIVLMFVESQRVYIQSTCKVCNKNLEPCSIK